MKIVMTLLKILVFLLMAAWLELNHHTLAGWFLTAAAVIGYLWLTRRYVRTWQKAGLFLCLLAVFALIVAVTWPPVKAVPAVNAKNPEQTEIRTVSDGKVRGVYTADGAVEVYAGIPYAAPPVGDLRWQEPQDPEPWQDILEADHFAPMSMQPVNLPAYDSLARIIGYHDYEVSLQDNYWPPVSEDSLYLNIWKPAGEEKDLPVLVYVHGGSLQTGQPWYEDYSGEGLARQGVIVVNMGYRLGVFGFFADEELQAESGHHTTGNYGLLDIIKALEWVQENIAAFGGDPGNVTLAGESAGAAAVSALCTSEPAAGLFQRVILESSTVAGIRPPHSYRSFADALSSGADLKQRHGVSSVAQLRALTAEELVAEASTQHHITVDGYVLKADPYKLYRQGIHNEAAILHGYNAQESAPFLLFSKTDLKNYRARVEAYFGEYTEDVLAICNPQTDEEAAAMWADIYGAVFFNYSHYCLNRLAAENNIPVYEYYFDRDNGRLGSWHSGEEVYCYDNIPAGSRLYDETDRQLAKIMSGYWADFAKSGDPNREGLPVWKENMDSRSLLKLSAETEMMTEPYLPLYEVLDRMYGWK